MGHEAFNTIDGLKTFGSIFKNLRIHDLSIYASKFGGLISYYRDSLDTEIDCVVHSNDGRYALIGCKLDKTKVDEGAKNLMKANKLVKPNNQV